MRCRLDWLRETGKATVPMVWWALSALTGGKAWCQQIWIGRYLKRLPFFNPSGVRTRLMRDALFGRATHPCGCGQVKRLNPQHDMGCCAVGALSVRKLFGYVPRLARRCCTKISEEGIAQANGPPPGDGLCRAA